jgi:hypothetical protein
LVTNGFKTRELLGVMGYGYGSLRYHFNFALLIFTPKSLSMLTSLWSDSLDSPGEKQVCMQKWQKIAGQPPEFGEVPGYETHSVRLLRGSAEESNGGPRTRVRRGLACHPQTTGLISQCCLGAVGGCSLDLIYKGLTSMEWAELS